MKDYLKPVMLVSAINSDALLSSEWDNTIIDIYGDIEG